MTHSQPRARNAATRLIPLIVSLVLVAACGQKSGVAESDASSATSPAPPADTAAPDVTQPPSTEPGASTTPAATTDSTGPAPETSAPTVATSEPAAVGPYEPGDNDTDGVTDDEIVIGIHSPVTGASPIPQTSFDIGKDIYWKYLAQTAPDTLFGRSVRVVFRDDEFDPQHAVQVCREMVEEEGAFMLVGGGGADQITACARYANDNGIPYISAGVNQTGLDDLDTYFATTLTYADQAPLLLDQIQKLGLTEIGLVVSDTPSFDDALAAIKAAADEAGVSIGYETRINKTAAEPEQLSVVQELKNTGVEAVILLSSPVVFIGLANQGLNQGFEPVWLGPGTTSGLNAVTTFGCPAVENGLFFSPAPGLDVIDAIDPDFNAAYPLVAEGNAPDDIGLQLWALNKALALVLETTGPELGRAAFMNTLVTTPSFDNGIYPPVSFTVDDHFGGTGAHLLDADCATKLYTTAEQFVTTG